jgi:hypothetical protein
MLRITKPTGRKAMSHQQIDQRYCIDCDKRVRVTRTGPNHLLHLILTVFTGGLWVFVWVFTGLKGSPYRCDICGSDNLADAEWYERTHSRAS